MHASRVVADPLLGPSKKARELSSAVKVCVRHSLQMICCLVVTAKALKQSDKERKLNKCMRKAKASSSVSPFMVDRTLAAKSCWKRKSFTGSGSASDISLKTTPNSYGK